MVNIMDLKRVFDIIGSAFIIVALAPIFLILMVIVRRKMGKPVLFRQLRPGLHEKPFQMLKFRTMRDSVDEKGQLLPDRLRFTKFGLFLRATSLDELPELVNVFRGEMSLVGPRPLLMKYLPYYRNNEKLRHTVRPGITGWAQINGRNSLGWDQKLALDVWYVENRSFWLDIKILCKTFLKVILREDVVPDAGDSVIDLDEERKALAMVDQQFD